MSLSLFLSLCLSLSLSFLQVKCPLVAAPLTTHRIPSTLWHDSIRCDMTRLDATRLIRMGHASSLWKCLIHCIFPAHCISPYAVTYGTWLMLTWHDSSVWDMSHSLHIPLRCDMTWFGVSWLIDVGHDTSICDMTHHYVTCLIDLSQVSCHTYESVMSHIDESCHVWIRHVTHNESCRIWMRHVT